MNRFPNLKALRIQHCYKQEYVADVLGISQPEYSKLETGARRIDGFIIKELCKLYDISPDLLLQQKYLPLPDVLNDIKIFPGQAPLSNDSVNKILDNYSVLFDNYVKQQHVQEKLIEKILRYLPERNKDHEA